MKQSGLVNEPLYANHLKIYHYLDSSVADTR